MKYTSKPESDDWQNLRALEEEIAQAGELSETSERWALLRRVARQVSFPADEAERLLQPGGQPSSLVAELRRRIREGSHKLGRAIISAQNHAELGQTDEARKALAEIVNTETVPYYREIAAAELRNLGLE